MFENKAVHNLTNKLPAIIIAAIAGVFFLTCSAAAIDTAPMLKVSVAAGDDCTLKAEQGLLIYYGDGNSITHAGPLKLQAKGGYILSDAPEICAKEVLVYPVSGFIRAGSREYRGGILAAAGKSGLNVINIINVEEYLYGVIKMEISTKWPVESVKAQAIAARTWAIKSAGKHAESGFDLCSGTHCQVYGGVGAEDSEAIQAVRETEGEILMYEDEPAFTPFHAACGGELASSEDVWGQDYPYLSRKKDPYCKNSPYRYWEKAYKKGDLERLLSGQGLWITGIKRIILKKRSGRTTQLVFIGKGNKKVTISSHKFRLLMGSNSIKSTYFSKIEIRRNDVLFCGFGWGHGVGMCQWGARYQAEAGRDYREILKFYYPRLNIEKKY